MPSASPLTRNVTHATRAGQVLVILVAVTVILVMMPVVIRGAPLRDDFDLCVNPRWTSGLGHAYKEIIPETGAVRLPGRLAQVGVIAGLCGRVPFSLLILLPLVLMLGVGLLLYGLLADLGVRPPWPYIGVAAWLLQPLGTEAAVWAVDFNVPLALLLSLAALRAYRRGNLVLAGAATLAAYGFVEHVIFALPIAALLVVPRELRRRAVTVAGSISVVVLAIYLTWPGSSSRTAVAVPDRVAGIITDPAWYAKFPAIGLGLHSIPVAIWWAFPVSLVALVVGATAGSLAGPHLLGRPPEDAQSHGPARPSVLGFFLLLLALNVPLMTTLPHPDSPRTFTPTWLALSAALAIFGARIRWNRVRFVGGVGGVLAAGALLSIALSVNVRVRTADFTEASSYWLARRVPENGTVAVCHVPRTAVEPAPAGDFAVHEFIETWSAEAALRYYTGRTAKIIRVGRVGDPRCESPPPADLVVNFDDLPHQISRGPR